MAFITGKFLRAINLQLSKNEENLCNLHNASTGVHLIELNYSLHENYSV